VVSLNERDGDAKRLSLKIITDKPSCDFFEGGPRRGGALANVRIRF
jgi:hypothetical protein